MAKHRLWYSYNQIAQMAGYSDCDKFRKDLSRAKINILPEATSLELRASRFDSVQAIRALALAALRRMGVPVATSARYLKCLQSEPVSLALDRASHSLFLGWDAGNKYTCSIAVDRGEMLLDALGPGAFIVKIDIGKDLQ